MEHNEHPVQPDSFETGSTNPPKKRGGIIAVVLVTVIFLGGFVRGFGLLNIRLFPPLSAHGTAVHAQPERQSIKGLPDPGFSGDTVSALSQRFHRYPDGVLVRSVTPKGSAASSGVTAGDVLVQLDGQNIPDADALYRVLRQHQPGDRLIAVFYRGDTRYSCQITLAPVN